MIGKLGLLLFFLQLLHSSMANKTILAQSKIITPAASIDELRGNFPVQIGNKLYRISEKLSSWYQAIHICRQLGGNLLNIESSEEMDALLTVFTDNYIWLSGYCLAGNREFISITTGEPIPYERWNAGEPNNYNGEEYCLELKYSKLNDSKCIVVKKFICEAKIMY